MTIEHSRNRRVLDFMAFWLALSAIGFILMGETAIALIPIGMTMLCSLTSFVVETRLIRRAKQALSFVEIKYYASGMIQRDVQ